MRERRSKPVMVREKIFCGMSYRSAARWIALAALVFAVGIFHAASSRAQSAATSSAFDVASIKPNQSTDFRLQMESLPGGTLRVMNFPLKLIIIKAYGLPLQSSQRLSGGPDWINSEKYDIEAKAPPGAVPVELSGKSRSDRLMLMLQTLLADRFKLTVHRETKQMTVYALVASKNGPRVQRAKIDEKDCPESSNLVAPAPGSDYCHAFFGGQGRGIHGKTVTMSDLATWLENSTDHPVLDKTGYKALFDIDTEGWGSMNSPPGPATPEAALDGPQSLPSVLDKAGLKLEATKGAVEVIVIDHVERPSAN
jgi:uncharacterized protein (TIGR03435 family)